MKSLTSEYKEWICDNLEWMIDVLGYEKFFRRPFFDYSTSSLQKFNKEDTFSLDGFSDFLCELLEIKEQITLDIREYPATIDKKNTIYINDPNQQSREELIKYVTEEILIRKASELGLAWENTEDDTIIIGLLSAFYGVTTLLIENNQLIIKQIPLQNQVFEYLLAVIFSVKEDEQLSFLDLFDKTIVENAKKSLQNDTTIHNFQKLTNQFKDSDKINEDLKQAQQMQKKGYLPLAISILQNLCNHSPHRVILWNTLGYYQQKNKQFNESINSFDEALKIESDFIDSLNNKGLSFLLMQQIEKSETYFIKALNIDPNNPLVIRNIGIYYSATNELIKAEKYFKKAIKINPSTELVYFYYAIFLLQKNDKNKAIIQLNISASYGEVEAENKLLKLRS
jgi:tetratricopeptide (TPR) repeat protein